MTLPNSPELNPLDYSIWDCISNRISYEKVETSDDLRRKIQKSIKKIRCKLRTGHDRCLPLSSAFCRKT